MNYQLVFSSGFQRAVKKIKRNTDLLIDLQKALVVLQNDPFDPRLKTHKLKGILDGLYASSVDFEHRIIFNLIYESDTSAVLLIDFGTHDEVY